MAYVDPRGPAFAADPTMQPDIRDNPESIDHGNQWLRAQPWYQQFLASIGQTPGNAHLTDAQQQQLMQWGQQNHLPVDDQHWEFDASGNLREQTHKLRNTLVGGSLAAGFLAPFALGAAGAAGAAGAGSSAAGGGLASTTIGSGMIPGIAGGTGMLDAAGTLASTQIGTGLIPGIVGGTGMVHGAAGGAGLGSILGTAGTIGDKLSAVAGGFQQGRQQQTQNQQIGDRLAQERYQSELAAARLNLDAPSVRGSQAVRGDILSNAKDFAYGAPTMVGNIPVPTSTGGLRPSIFSDATRKLGSQLSTQALTDQTTNGGRVIGPPPPISPLPEASAGASILGTAGIMGQLAGLLDPNRRPRTVQQDPNQQGWM